MCGFCYEIHFTELNRLFGGEDRFLRFKTLALLRVPIIIWIEDA
jgi:hypothetical protein